MHRLYSLLAVVSLWTLLPASSHAQLDGVLETNAPVQRFLERHQARGLLPLAHLSHQPLSAREAQRYLDSLALHDSLLTPVDRQRLAWYRGTAPGPGAEWARELASFLYPDGHSLLAVLHDDYAVRIDPLLHTSIGPARRTEREGRDPSLFAWQYGRGLRASGHIGRYVFFEARLTENRRRPVWSIYEGGTAERLGFVALHDSIYDYFAATGVVGFHSKYFEARFGRDRNAWGVGRSSVILSDFAAPYDFLQLRTTLGRFQYVNLFAGLTDKDLRVTQRNLPIPRKYAAFHRLSVALPGGVHLGVFEAVSFGSDSLGIRRGFDVSYLNPVIFIRSVERDRGSPDNVLLGGDVAWVPVGGLRLYGQLLLDELKVDEIGNEWWGNKWGWILGADVVDLPLPNLALKLEFARLRPFLYAHRSPSTSYVHYGEVLGHPVGPNAFDVMVEVRYAPTARINAALSIARTMRGRSSDDQNYGSDPRESYNTRIANHGFALLDGIRQTEWLVEAYAGYELLPRLHVDAALRMRSLDDAELGLNRFLLPMLQIRWGTAPESARW